MTHPLLRQVRSIGQQARLWMVGSVFAWTVGMIVTSVLLVGVLDYVFVVRDIGVRLLGTVAVLVSASLAVWRFMKVACQERYDDVTLARRIETHLSAPDEQLSSAIAFLQQAEDDRAAGSVELRRVVIAEMTSCCADVGLPRLVDRRPMVGAAVYLCVVVILIGCFWWLDGSALARAVQRMVIPWSAVTWNRLELVDVPMRIAAGEDFLVQVGDLDGRLPTKIQVEFWLEGDVVGQIRQASIQPKGRFASYQMPAVDRSFRVRASGGDDHSMPWHEITVVDPPQLRELVITLHPPPYTGWAPFVAEDPLLALVGTKVSLCGSVTKEVSSVVVHVETHEEKIEFSPVLAEDGMQFVMEGNAAGTWTVDKSAFVDIDLHGRNGFFSRSAPRQEIRAIVHRAPEVLLKQPAGQQFVTPRAQLPLEISVTEQICVEQVQIRLRRLGTATDSETSIEIYTRPEHEIPSVPEGWASDDPMTRTYRAELDLTALSPLPPGTRLEIRALAANGQPLVGQSESRQLLVVSDEELLDRLVGSQRSVLHQLAEMLDQQRQARLRTATLGIGLQERGRMRPADENELQNAEYVQHQVRLYLRENKDSVLPRLERILDQLEQNRLQSTDLQQTVQRLYDELDNLDRDGLTTLDQEFVVLRRAARDLRFGLELSLDHPTASAAGTGSLEDVRNKLHGIGDSQDLVIERLESLRREFNQWDSYHSLVGEFVKMRQQQDSLLQRTKKYRLDTISDPLPETEQRAMLGSLLHEQFEMGRCFDEIQRRMGDMRDALLEKDAIAAETVGDALYRGVRLGVRRKMQQAREAIKNTQVGRAAGTQAQLVDDLQEIIDVLTHRDQGRSERRQVQLKAAAKELEALIVRLKEPRAVLESANVESRSAEAGSLEDAAKAMDGLRKLAQQLAGQLARLQASRAAREVEHAAANLGHSAEAASQGNVNQARPPAGQAETELAAARHRIQQTLRQVQRSLVREQLVQLEQQLLGWIARQKMAAEEIVRLHELQIGQGAPIPDQPGRLHRVTVDESTLAEEIQQLAAKIKQMAIVRHALLRVAGQMQHVVGRLEENETDQATQFSARAAQAGLVRLQKVLGEETHQKRQTEAAATSGSSGSRPSAVNSPIHLAELKLLRALQEDLWQRTEKMERERTASKPLSDAQQRDLRQLAEEQKQLSEWTLQMLGVQESKVESE